MITVKYTRYRNDYDRKAETKSMYSLEDLADWLFGKCKGSYEYGMYFTNPDDNRLHFYDGKLKLDNSCISVNYDDTGYCTWIEQIEENGKIIYSTGKYTNGICHWNETIKQWLRDCRARQKNPQFNFG